MEKVENVLKVTVQAVTTDLLKEAKSMAVPSETSSFVCSVYVTGLCDFEKLLEANDGEWLAEYAKLLPLEPPYNVVGKSDLETSSHALFWTNKVDEFCKRTD